MERGNETSKVGCTMRVQRMYNESAKNVHHIRNIIGRTK